MPRAQYHARIRDGDADLPASDGKGLGNRTGGVELEVRAAGHQRMDHGAAYAVDVATPLADETGELKESLTTDGLHPDAEAKKIIGEIIGQYLREKFNL